eukprot:SM000088S23724  [mRNA]  locus=s88:368645:370352:+ [translate_table: standard]
MRCGEPAFAPARKWRRLDEILRTTKKITKPLHIDSCQKVVNRPVTRYGGLSATVAEVADSSRPGNPSLELQVAAVPAEQEVERAADEPGGLATTVRAAAVKELQLLFKHRPLAQVDHQPIESRGGGDAKLPPDTGGSTVSKHRRDLVALQTCSCSRNLENAGQCKVPRQGDVKSQGKACEGSGSGSEPDIVPLLFLKGGGVALPQLVSGLCLLGSPDARRGNDQHDNRGPPQASNANCSCNVRPASKCLQTHSYQSGSVPDSHGPDRSNDAQSEAARPSDHRPPWRQSFRLSFAIRLTQPPRCRRRCRCGPGRRRHGCRPELAIGALPQPTEEEAPF